MASPRSPRETATPAVTRAALALRPQSTDGASPSNGLPTDDKMSSTLHVTDHFGLQHGPRTGDPRMVVVVYGPGQEKVISAFADVLGRPYVLVDRFAGVTSAMEKKVMGILAEDAKADIAARDRALVVTINAHRVGSANTAPDELISAQCDYEFLYTESPCCRRDLARFTSFVLGQINHHEALMAKPRTFFISTTFPDVRAALPNLEILTVGADAVEIRIDLLSEPVSGGGHSAIPSLSYVGQQVMLLRQRTELPLIFTTRCVKENGRFLMDKPELFRQYLHRAIKWGVEYIDVEVWLPDAIRQDLFESRGNSRVMSAWHDFSGTFKWPSALAESVFLESRRWADIVKMIAYVNDPSENFELEYFRSKIQADFPDAPPLSMVNMGETGKFSRTMNKVFTPITHPLLPRIAAPGQMSAAEINSMLAALGQLPKKYIYGMTRPLFGYSLPQHSFYEKCLNELGLPHHFGIVERQTMASRDIEMWCNQRHFGGAYLSPPALITALMNSSPFLSRLRQGAGPILTEAARTTGVVDTIVVRFDKKPTAESAPASIPSTPGHGPRFVGAGFHAPAQSHQGLPSNASLVFDNASWRGIISTLTRDVAPSAYKGRTAVVLASCPDDAASAIFALRALQVGKICTVGFGTPPALARGLVIEQFRSLESLQRARSLSDDENPFALVSALGPDKGNIVGLLVRVFGANRAGLPTTPSLSTNARKVFLDLADGPRNGGDPAAVAERNGYNVYGVADTMAFTTVEILRLLVGQNVPYSFVRLASGTGLF